MSETWVEEVHASSAVFHARLDAGGLATGAHFEYLSEAAYTANLTATGEGFLGAGRVPGTDKNVGKAATATLAAQVTGLQPEATYVYRVVASNVEGTVTGPLRRLTTEGGGGPLVLLDGRGWEMVSPVDKNGGGVQDVGETVGGGVLQASVQGGAVTFSSVTSFAGGGGAPAGSQYVSRRSAAGWSTENVTPVAFGGAYGQPPNGVPYQLFSFDLDRALLTGIPELPLPGTAAPAGYANYYVRGAGGDFEALLTQAGVSGLSLPPGELHLAFAGASSDLSHVVLSTCAALTEDASEVAGAEGCDVNSPNLYEWSGAGLRLINLLPGDSSGTPSARLAARSGAISNDGSRVYWTDGNDLYLREGDHTTQVDAAVGGGGDFQTATPDGLHAFFTKGEHLYSYTAGSEAIMDLTPAGGVEGVLGVADDGSRAYFATASGIFDAVGGSVAHVADAPEADNYPPDVGTARVNADGSKLLFVSRAELKAYDNTDTATGEPDAEVYLYDALGGSLTCVSCNPSGERPRGSASVPGAVGNGAGEGATRAYKARVLVDGGRRVFFETPDRLTVQDNDGASDVYEWEAAGTGSCARPPGCVQLISGGQSAGGASFVDASGDGADAFFLTDASLLKGDPGAVDLYDAREGGGFPEPEAPIPCEEDACQPLPSSPDDPAPGTLLPSGGNPPAHFPKRARRHHRKHQGHRRKTRHHR